VPAAPGRNRAVGAQGEDLVASWYSASGYRVLARNWRCREGELDIVASKGRTLAICEVKARSGSLFGLPAEAVGRAKQARLRRLAARWLAENRERAGGHPWTVRFDVASVLAGEVDVIEGAF
jgi:putative endonuclease